MKEDFGRYLQHLRHRRNIPLPAAAAFIGASATQLERIEAGRRYATRQQVLDLAAFFGEDACSLLIGSQYQRMADVEGHRHDLMQRELAEMLHRKLCIQMYRPAYPLNQYVETIIFYSGHNFGLSRETIQPDGTTRLVVELGGGERSLLSGNSRRTLRNAWVTGVQGKPLTFEVGAMQTTLIVRFLPGGLYAFTGMPQYLLRDEVVAAEALFGPAVNSLREEMIASAAPEALFRKMEGFLRLRLQQKDMEHAVVRHVSSHIFTPFPLLIKQTGYSQKHLIRIFSKHTGVTPKLFHRICRYNAALQDILAVKGKVSWAAVTYDHHYYDQAHFIREFRLFSGHSPERFLDTGSSCPKCLRT